MASNRYRRFPKPMEELPRLTVVSMGMSKILRHDAEKFGLKLDDKAYANLGELLNIPRMKPLNASLAEVKRIVAEDKKQRFSLLSVSSIPPESTEDAAAAAAMPDSDNPADYKIRANQGHSFALSTTDHLEPLTVDTLPPFIIHGTYFCFWNPILASGGLSTMGRNHVHFVAELPEKKGTVVSGMRHDCSLFVFVDTKKAVDIGLKFWRSSNNVILSEGNEKGIIPMEVIDKVEDRKRRIGKLWEHGKVVQELPAELANISPPLDIPDFKSPLHHLAEEVLRNLKLQHDWVDLHLLLQDMDGIPLPRPLVSGIPPFRLYVHPDDKDRSTNVPGREWVLPTFLGEPWSIRSMAAVFDSVEDEIHFRRGEAKRVVLATVCTDSTVTYYFVHDGVVKPRQN